MRIVASCAVLIAALATSFAAPVNPPSASSLRNSPDHALRAEALNYAENLIQVIDRIELKYVRPVSRVDLVEVAVTGLYEAAQVPIPPVLRAEIQRGVATDLPGMLCRIRESLGQQDAIRGSKALLVSLQALPRALDPFCGLTVRREFQWLELHDSTPNVGLSFVGLPLNATVGVGIPNRVRLAPSELRSADRASIPAGPLVVQYVQPGSPAQQAGIRPGDLIARINGQPPETPDYSHLLQRLRPFLPGIPFDPADPPLRLSILRPGNSNALQISVGPAAYRPESVFGAHRKRDGAWDFMLDHSERIGYVRIGGIRRGDSADGPGDRYGTHREFRDALKSLSASNVRGLILDLRWCPGGYLDEATSIARLLLDRDNLPIAKQRERGGVETAVEFTELDRAYTEFPVVVLINGETSGGGELIAAALQDYGRATIAGQRTVGKATIQKEMEPDGIPFRLTQGTFHRPGGKNLQRFPDNKFSDDWGVSPDAGCELPLTAAAAQRLKDSTILWTLRPAKANEAMPLDDPENDPQRSAAVQILRQKLKK